MHNYGYTYAGDIDRSVGGLYTVLENEKRNDNFRACIEWEKANYMQGKPHMNTSAYEIALRELAELFFESKT